MPQHTLAYAAGSGSLQSLLLEQGSAYDCRDSMSTQMQQYNDTYIAEHTFTTLFTTATHASLLLSLLLLPARVLWLLSREPQDTSNEPQGALNAALS